jgi:hypothetical protein
LVACIGCVGVLVACGEQAVDYPDGVDPGKSNGEACTKDADCKGICLDSKCAACGSSAQCKDPARSVCDVATGACGGCTTSSQCPPGLACVNSACTACTTNTQCAAGQACVNGACGACTSNTQCASTEQCLNGQCTSNGTTPPGPTLDSGVDACVAGYVGFVGPVGSVWGNPTNGTPPGFGPAAGGQVGTAAGNSACTLAYAGSHACSWEEVKQSDVCGKLAALKNTVVTAWMHRTAAETALSDDNPTLPAGPAAPGARCNDWTYGTNHAYDGEFIEFGAGAMKGHFDSDTANDGPTPPGGGSAHAVGGALQCNGESRDVLCCN